MLLKGMMRDGTLRKIFERWNAWDEEQAVFQTRALAAYSGQAPPGAEALPSNAPSSLPSKKSSSSLSLVFSYLPSLLKASLVTIVLTCLSMALAVLLGVAIASGRVYGNAPLRMLLMGYVELMRGTPVLLQLFVLYDGLSEVVRLPAFVAAFLGLGLNYAAYESEIYRGALEAVPKGQLEAARTLGLTEGQVLRLVRGPHALGRPRAEAEARARSLLEGLGVVVRSHSRPRELSGGEVQRVAIARALAVDPPLLLMDEPTASLDPARRSELGESLETLTGQGRTLLVATHDDDFARDFATRVVILSAGAVVEEGPPEEVLVHPRHPATRQLLQSKGRKISSAPPL